MTKLVEQLAAYFSTNGTFSDAVNLANLVAAGAWGEIRHLASIIGL